MLPGVCTLLLFTAIVNALDAKTVSAILSPSASCASGQTECRTAEQAAPFIAKGFCSQGISAPGAQAAAISLMAFESGDFKYKHNVSPGRKGQGTANMQMWPYNLKYAQSLPGGQDKAKGLVAGSEVSDDKTKQIMDFVTSDEYNFGSAAWFLKTQCPPDVLAAFDQGKDVNAAYAKYMGCVGVQVTPDRQKYWDRAKTAFGL